ncbi:ABC transporter permease [Anaerostipes sp.]|uniref:ABC transporter permease n=1 Tax=Anaerostipes sp. TaxID=1872530 RepID=UPI0025B9AED8|nr:ABC transporter permease [Anaerostipes sp.]MBS7009800.1 ABC transporter permease [Anaerostipes sp.]
MKTFKTMLKTELKLSLRGMDMFIFAICVPLIVLAVVGIIYGNKPALDGAGYTFFEQSFGAAATISICAGGVMGLPLVISDYRSKGILKRYQVTPVSPVMLLSVQTAVYAIYSVTSLFLLYLEAVFFFGYEFRGNPAGFFGCYLLTIVSMFSIGIMVGGTAPNAKIAGVIASILYFPMLIFSGATLPYEIMPESLQTVSDFLPLTQGIKLLKAASLGENLGSVIIPVISVAVTAAVCTAIALKFFQWD